MILNPFPKYNRTWSYFIIVTQHFVYVFNLPSITLLKLVYKVNENLVAKFTGVGWLFGLLFLFVNLSLHFSFPWMWPSREAVYGRFSSLVIHFVREDCPVSVFFSLVSWFLFVLLSFKCVQPLIHGGTAEFSVYTGFYDYPHLKHENIKL